MVSQMTNVSSPGQAGFRINNGKTHVHTRVVLRCREQDKYDTRSAVPIFAKAWPASVVPDEFTHLPNTSVTALRTVSKVFVSNSEIVSYSSFALDFTLYFIMVLLVSIFPGQVFSGGRSPRACGKAATLLVSTGL